MKQQYEQEVKAPATEPIGEDQVGRNAVGTEDTDEQVQESDLDPREHSEQIIGSI